MTNLEKIKTLDLDSMTDFIYYAKLCGCGKTCTNKAETDCATSSCFSNIKAWLQQEAIEC